MQILKKMNLIKYLLLAFIVFSFHFCKKNQEAIAEDNKNYYFAIEKTQFRKSWENDKNLISEINPGTKLEILKTTNNNWNYVSINNQIGFIKQESISKLQVPNNCRSFENLLEQNFKKIGEPKIFDSRNKSNKSDLIDDHYVVRTKQAYSSNTDYIIEEYYEGGSETIILENISMTEGLLIGILCNELFSDIDISLYKDKDKIDIQHPSGGFLWLSVKRVGKNIQIRYSTTS